jgi:hypothetical protein
VQAARAPLPPPDFAIVGAPRCGTTALYTYLSTHPSISMSSHKEPHFWSPDVPRLLKISDPGNYAALWNGAPPGSLRGEASPDYLRSQVAVPRMLAARPDIRFVAMVRNPVEVVTSLHSIMVLSLNEDVRDFETAWRLQSRRQRGQCIPAECVEPGMLEYEAYSLIGDQLDRFIKTVPPGQRAVIVYDDFRSDPRGEYLRVLNLLGLPDDGRADFARVSANRALRSPILARLARSIPRRLGPLYAPARAAARAFGIRPLTLVERVNRPLAPRKPLRAAFEAELIANFLPQIEKVEELLGRDLTRWKAPVAT